MLSATGAVAAVGLTNERVVAADSGGGQAPNASVLSPAPTVAPAVPPVNPASPKPGSEKPFDKPATWDAAKNALETVYGRFPVDAQGSRVPTARPLSVTFAAAAGDVRYLPRHADSLLLEAANLLDRGIRSRVEWQDLNARAFSQYLEIQELIELDKVHADEVAAGYYTLPFKLSSAEVNALGQTAVGADAARQYVQWMLDNWFTPAQMNKLYNAMIELNWLSHLPTYSTPVSDPNPLQHNYAGDVASAPNLAVHATQVTAWEAIVAEQASLLAAAATNSSVVGATNQRRNGASAQTAWNASDADFRRRRTEVSRRIMQAKADESTRAGGATNFLERMGPLQARFERDFRDALARMSAIKDGLQSIYAYSASPLPLAASPTQFDDALLWLRDAGAFYGGFAALEQEYVFTVSLRALMGKPAFTRGLSSPNSGAWTFTLDSSYFPDQRHIRLRGVSAYVVAKQDPRATWQLALQAPQNGVIFQIGKTEPVPLPQPSPVIRLARIRSRDSFQEADVVGMTALRNVSPLSSGLDVWKVAISDTQKPPSVSATGGGFDPSAVSIFDRVAGNGLEDVQIDLHLAVRTIDPAAPGSPFSVAVDGRRKKKDAVR
jgi:hypothetical protein